MKRVALIRPYYKEIIQQMSYPLGLGYLAAVLRERGYRVRIFDLNMLRTPNAQFVQKLQDYPVDILGVTALTWYYPEMVELCRLVKGSSHLREKPLLIGGVHPSALPELSLRETGADFVVIGEGERTLVTLLETIEQGGDPRIVKGIGFLEADGTYVETGPCDLIRDLDALPLPAWDLIHPRKFPYQPHNFFYKRKPVFPVFTSRGCPFQCEYCASKNFWRQQIRYRSIPAVVDEIEFLHDKYGAREIQIWDDNFTLHRRRVVEFVKEVKDRGLRLYFSCPNGVKVDTLDYSLLKLLRGIGFYSLTFAIETASPRVQRNIKKNLDLTRVPAIIQHARDLGFFTRAFFIFGLPTETVAEVHQTLEFALQLPVDQANFFIFSPLPGSTFFYRWIKTRDLTGLEWDFDFFNNPQDMRGFNSIPREQILKLQNYIYIRFLIFRPLKFVKWFLRIKISQYVLIINRLVYKLKNLF